MKNTQVMKFKKDSIYIRNESFGNIAKHGQKEGDIIKCFKDSDYRCYYQEFTNSSNFRPATPQEINLYNAGIRNINDSPIDLDNFCVKQHMLDGKEFIREYIEICERGGVSFIRSWGGDSDSYGVLNGVATCLFILQENTGHTFNTLQEFENYINSLNKDTTMNKAMKFKVHSPEHSKAIQERLFELGYEWGAYGKEVKFSQAAYLFASDLQVTYVDTFDFFEGSSNKETTLDDLFKMSAPLKVKLNDEYTAEINKQDRTVKVGCQVFKFEAIEKLHKEIS